MKNTINYKNKCHILLHNPQALPGILDSCLTFSKNENKNHIFILAPSKKCIYKKNPKFQQLTAKQKI